MFAGIADFVVRRHKIIVIAWILIFVIGTVVLAPNVNSVVQFEETESAPSDLESAVAQDFINNNFGNSSEQPTTLIVITAPNVLSDDVKSAVMNITNDLNNASMDGTIHKVSVRTAYTIAEVYTLNVLVALNDAYQGANLTAYAIYGLPQDFRTMWQEANQTAHAFYDIPANYALIWENINATMVPPGTPVGVVDNATYSTMLDQLNASSTSMSRDQKAFLFGWFNAFTAGWNSTEALSSQPQLRAQTAHSAAFTPFVENLTMSTEQKMFLVQVNETFSSLTVDFQNVTVFTKGVLDQNIDSMTGSMSGDQMTMVHAYLDAVVGWWNSTGSEPNQTVFETGVLNVAQNFGQSIADQTTKATFLGLLQAFGGFANYNDNASRQGIVSNLLASNPALAQKLGPKPWVIVAAGELGASPSPSSVMLLSQRIVANSSLSDFPIKIPADIVGILVSPDNSTTIIALTYKPVANVSAPGQLDVGQVRTYVRDATAGTDIKAYVSGSDPISTDLQDSTFRDLEIIEPITIVLVLVLIGLYFRSFVASSIPPMIIGMALGIAYGIVYLIGYFVMPIHYSVLTLLLTSMMGAGCDYCIFILSRYREERHNGHDKDESVRQAVTWAGESIATSGATVIIGFGVLSIGRFSMMQSMGISLALGVTVALLVALTLLPALLVLWGDKLFWPGKMNRSEKVRNKNGYFTRSARFAIKNAKVIVVVAVLISIPTTYLVYSLETSYDFIGSMPETESKKGISAMNSGFGGGLVTPTQIGLKMSGPVTTGSGYDTARMQAIENVSSTLAGLPNIKKVTSPTRPNGVPINYSDPSLMSQYQANIAQMMSTDGKAVLITVVFQAEPFQKESINSIQDLRGVAVEAESDPLIEKMYVGGSTASMYDISNMVQGDFNNMEVLVVIGIYIVLLVVLGSVINPLRSILTILLSISWTLAATLVLFTFVLGQPILYMVPMILLIVCLGLGMDYDILLTTRIREEATRGKENNEAITYAVEKTGGIITACGIIMAAAFGSMMLSNGFLLKQFGFALMFAILLDAMIVRIYLVPAIMSMLGKWNWWAPGPIQRINAKRAERRVEEIRHSEETRHFEDEGAK